MTVRRVFLGVTGASGALYGGRLLRALTAAGCEVGLCASEAGVQVAAHETLGMGPRPAASRDEILARFVDRFADAAGSVSVLDLHDLTQPWASGSSLGPAAVVAPCSMSTLAAVAHGIGGNLIHRAADVMLKERRTLILVPRETPLSLVHLENMAAVTRAGAVVLPAMPGLYTLPATVEEMVDFVVGKILDRLGVPHDLLRRWGERPAGLAR
jgi:4-hydroxy-3-polyprenylbenzoate decarboxylase